MESSGQFSSFDGLDNRRTLMELFQRMGGDLPDDLAGMRRAGFLSGLLSLSQNSFAQREMLVTPCTAVEAYNLFVAICGCLMVSIDCAAQLLERALKEVEKKPDKVLVG